MSHQTKGILINIQRFSTTPLLWFCLVHYGRKICSHKVSGESHLQFKILDGNRGQGRVPLTQVTESPVSVQYKYYYRWFAYVFIHHLFLLRFNIHFTLSKEYIDNNLEYIDNILVMFCVPFYTTIPSTLGWLPWSLWWGREGGEPLMAELQ